MTLFFSSHEIFQVETEHINMFAMDARTNQLVNFDTGAPAVGMGAGIASSVLKSGRPVLINNAAADARVHDDGTFQSLLAVPVKDQLGETCAVLQLINKIDRTRSVLSPTSASVRLPSDGTAATNSAALSSSAPAASPQAAAAAVTGSKSISVFTPDDQVLLQAVASTASGILTMARLYEEAERRRKQTETLLRISELMSADLDLGKVVPRILEAAYQLVPAERISLFLVEDPTRALLQPDGREARDDTIPLSADASTVSETISDPASATTPSTAPPSQLLSRLSSCVSPVPVDSSQSDIRLTRHLICVVSKDERFRGARIPWGSGIVGHVAATGKSVNIIDAYSDERFVVGIL
jgi:GAF domain-containing protein